jgi:hypothetical protein
MTVPRRIQRGGTHGAQPPALATLLPRQQGKRWATGVHSTALRNVEPADITREIAQGRATPDVFASACRPVRIPLGSLSFSRVSRYLLISPIPVCTPFARSSEIPIDVGNVVRGKTIARDQPTRPVSRPADQSETVAA